MPTCKSCGAVIDWVKTSRGKMMPVDEDYLDYSEVDTGTVLVTDDGEVVVVRDGVDRPDVYGRISHFSTCPEAEQWRRN